MGRLEAKTRSRREAAGRRALVIVGAGPAGVAAAVQAARDDLDVLVVADEPVGGLVRAARWIENLPGVPRGIRGDALARSLEAQLGALGVPLRRARVLRLALHPSGFCLELSGGGALECGAVVLATGTAPAPFAVPGAEDARSAGRLHRDVRTLGADLGGAPVLVAGGGDAALDSALWAHDHGAAVRVLLRGEATRASAHLVRAVRLAGIPLEAGRRVSRLTPTGTDLRVTVVGPAGAEERPCAHLLACIGRTPRDALLADLALDAGEPLADLALDAGEPLAHVGDAVTTAIPGLLVAGDLRRGRERFVASAFGDGQTAARLARTHLEKRSSP